ncbi:hypothetical protein POM88_035779 [Heracleum sosnowskyi]|uniref:Uncharacterized protein n=1 Tax=Heracleum sosnowskyi TaxID=360622 RepID=A0AAD8HNY8_9APIA|nr:hypothetical protein POM88_035779 [Heracleum sosnowskyi]
MNEIGAKLSSIMTYKVEDEMRIRKPYQGLIRSLQQLGCTHVLDLYSQGLTSRTGRFQHDFEFIELQYEKLLGMLETGIFPYFMMVMCVWGGQIGPTNRHWVHWAMENEKGKLFKKSVRIACHALFFLREVFTCI